MYTIINASSARKIVYTVDVHTANGYMFYEIINKHTATTYTLTHNWV